MTVTYLNLPGKSDTEALSKSAADTGKTVWAAAVSGGIQTNRNDLAPNLKIVFVPVSDIKEANNRVRKPSDKRIKKLEKVIKTFGVRRPVLLHGQLQIIDGHDLVAVAKMLGIKSIPCIIADDLSELEVRALRIALNKTQEGGVWDVNALHDEFTYLLEFETDLAFTGFEVAEIDQIVVLDDVTQQAGSIHPADIINEGPATEADAVTWPGDLWRLCEHRIYCGNARDPESLAILTGGATVSAVFTDPPYNVQVNGHVCVTSGKFDEFAEASGEMSPVEYTGFLKEAIDAMATCLKPGGVLFICMDWRHLPDLTSVLYDLELELLNTCVWVKDKPGMGSFYRSQYEIVLVARKAGASHMNNIQLGKFGRNRSNVWHYAGATGGKKFDIDNFKLHPTVKPVNLVRDAILDVTAIDDVVLDPFLGSGTTVLAAEIVRRKCFGLEISPTYVDVAIGRWEALTGLEAVHHETGLTFAEMRVARASDGYTAPEMTSLVSGSKGDF